MFSRSRLISAFISEVDAVLLSEWDPIGVRSVPEAVDEYTSYAPGIAGMILKGGTLEEIATHLMEIEKDRMGLEPSWDRASSVSRRLIELQKGAIA